MPTAAEIAWNVCMREKEPSCGRHKYEQQQKKEAEESNLRQLGAVSISGKHLWVRPGGLIVWQWGFVQALVPSVRRAYHGEKLSPL